MPPERRAYPTAPTLTRPSYARPGTPHRSRTTHTPSPIPATVWTCPPAPLEPTGFPAPAGTWAAAIIVEIVSSFSEPHGWVGILPWPTSTALLSGTDRLSTSDGTRSEDASGATSVAGHVVAAITAQHRHLVHLSFRTVPVDAGTDAARGSCRRQPRLAEVSPIESAASAVSPEAARATQQSPLRSEPGVPLDLIISSVAPALVDEASATQVTLAAAAALRLGGVLAVLTHSHHVDGRLVDPGGLLVSAAQNADLLYLQHIVALHAPTTQAGASSAPGTDPAQPHARGWPVRHRRTHADLYVFGQPHDHHTPDDSPLDDAASVASRAWSPAAGEPR